MPHNLSKTSSHRLGKPGNDVALEGSLLNSQNTGHLERQAYLRALLNNGPTRIHCCICEGSLGSSDKFSHRHATFIVCSHCGHIQSAQHPTKEHQAAFESQNLYTQIYSSNITVDFISKVKRIYSPKLSWIKESLISSGMTQSEFEKMKWVELGSGSGQFLHALEAEGIHHAHGLEWDLNQVHYAQQHLTTGRCLHWMEPFEKALVDHPSDIYASFFALEHQNDPGAFFRAFAKKPAGTLLAFSVPLFGFSTLLEGFSENHFARTLDGGAHTQLFTRESVAYALAMGKLRVISDWTFGQDAMDLLRMLKLGIKENATSPWYMRQVDSLIPMMDNFQAVIDSFGMADSIHVLAIREDSVPQGMIKDST